MSSHHLSYLKPNILKDLDGGPICNMGRRVEVLSASAFVSPPPPRRCPTYTSCSLSVARPSHLSQGPALAPTGSELAAPAASHSLPSPQNSRVHSLGLLVVPSASGPSLSLLVRPLPRCVRAPLPPARCRAPPQPRGLLQLLSPVSSVRPLGHPGDCQGKAEVTLLLYS